MKTEKELRNILDKCKYHDWRFVLWHKGTEPYLQIQFFATDSTNPADARQWSSRKWMLSYHMTESEIVGTAFKALMSTLEHEAREFFTYEDSVVFNPHVSIRALMDAVKTEDIRRG